MPVTLEDIQKGLFIEHKPTGNIFFRMQGGYIKMNDETYLEYAANEDYIIISARPFKLADCELSRLNFTECPHCKKLF